MSQAIRAGEGQDGLALFVKCRYGYGPLFLLGRVALSVCGDLGACDVADDDD